MTIKPTRVFSDLPIPPGAVLAEELEARGMTQLELAVGLNRSPQVIDKIIEGKQVVTQSIAIALSEALEGIDADFWTGLEARYRRALARQSKQTESIV